MVWGCVVIALLVSEEERSHSFMTTLGENRDSLFSFFPGGCSWLFQLVRWCL